MRILIYNNDKIVHTVLFPEYDMYAVRYLLDFYLQLHSQDEKVVKSEQHIRFEIDFYIEPF